MISTFSHYPINSLYSLSSTLQDYADTGIDPAFDEDLEELERQFAELRMTFANN
jgi:hypothetical protein